MRISILKQWKKAYSEPLFELRMTGDQCTYVQISSEHQENNNEEDLY